MIRRAGCSLQIGHGHAGKKALEVLTQDWFGICGGLPWRLGLQIIVLHCGIDEQIRFFDHQHCNMRVDQLAFATNHFYNHGRAFAEIDTKQAATELRLNGIFFHRLRFFSIARTPQVKGLIRQV